MFKKAEVIKSHCSWNEKEYSWVAYQEITRDVYSDIFKACLAAGKECSKGISVIVRPAYNETDEQDKQYFREWRSFDGGEFNEVRWYI